MNKLLICFDGYNKFHLKNIKEDGFKIGKNNKTATDATIVKLCMAIPQAGFRHALSHFFL